MTLTVGQQIQGGKYSIEKVLGKGRFGITYKAKDAAGNAVAIKTLNDSLLHQLSPGEIDELESKFWNEAVKLAKCSHNRHIVQVQESLKEGKLCCIVMEYIDGVDLASRAQKQLPEKLALRYIQQIGEALMEVHSHQLQHLDIKPDNIVLRGGTSEAVLIDFGLARAFDHPLTTTRYGEQGYSALEMYSQRRPRGAYTDLYGLAATLYELLTGQVPVSAIERKDADARLIPPKEINSNISDRTNQAILKAMALDSGDRPQTVQEWLKLLGVKKPIPLPNWNAMEWFNAIIAVGAIGTLMIALLTYLNSNSPPPPNPEPPTSETIQP
ncbi:serine/threonine protein kinase [Laspinema olomoucense]|uniref:Serine/threonine protein kinase n=1 Tax=Laspinema olomoucense D3b TaxID=2953688 RepID=A0ABT2NFB5_9CYAN|nr:serine/threonine-protein kinase [Laspinema sp. D3b]MCT7980030.1 serine/threonine protein kinase [Laspinema sp. D3b]